MRTRVQRLSTLLAVCAPLVSQTTPQLELRPRDHIAIVGSATADRLQHTGWFEAMLHGHLPQHDLTVRTLAVAGDEVGTWHRSQGFGSRDEWLAKTGADVVFAFYGGNESFAGEAGLGRFRERLVGFVDGLRATSFGKNGPTRVVLFTPIAHERHRDPAFPDPTRNNANLQRYAAAIAEVARAKGVPCVDLFAASQELYAAAAAQGRSLTVNGLHLDDEGDRLLAPVMFRALFGGEPPAVDERLRQAVLDKSWCWHQRYRTIDGYNIYGGRSYEKYAPKDRSGVIGEPILNRTVMQREMEIRDVMTANRDARIWSLARGADRVVTDDNLPAPLPVATNHPGDRDDLSFTYPSGEAVIGKLKVASHCKVNLFADEAQFPELVNPVQMAWDARGRLWVAAWRNYPERSPGSPSGDSLLVLEDTDADGRADVCTAFATDLNAPTGFTFHRDGVLLMQAPDLWFLRDTDGDGRADSRQRVLMGIDSADSHHTTNAMGLDPSCATTLSDGYFHRTQIETWNGTLRHADGCIWRFEPRTGRVELYAPYELVNAHGKVWDEWGTDLLTNATGNHTFFGPAISGHLTKGKHPELKQFWDRPSRPCAGTGMVSSGHFPADWQGDFLNCNVIGLQGITRVDVLPDGSGLRGETVEHLVVADPAELPTFRPVCVGNGPDGALYFADWAQAIIGHLQHHLRDPNRDHQHGRIYRVTYEGRPLVVPPRIAGESIEHLLDLLTAEVQDTRTLAKLELGNQEPAKVTAALRKWVAARDEQEPRHEHHLLEALWLCQSLDVVDRDLLDRVLRSPEPRARAAATKVLCDWRDRVPDVLERLLQLAGDEDARVRLHAVRAASFFAGDRAKRAAEVAFAALRRPTDYYLDYVFDETLRQLNTEVDEVLLPSEGALAAVYVRRMPVEALRRASATPEVLVERIGRSSIEPPLRQQALDALAVLQQTDRATVLVQSLARLDDRDGDAVVDDLARALGSAAASELAPHRAALEALADAARRPVVRRAALAALVVLAEDGAKVFAAAGDQARREQTVAVIPLLRRSDLRETFAPVVATILADAEADGALRAAALAALPFVPTDAPEQHFAALAKALQGGPARATAARALLQLPRSSWEPAAAGAAAESVLAWAGGVPAEQRTQQDFLETVQCAEELAGLMPPADATRVRQQLRRLGVPVFVLHTLREQMRYDRERIVVEVGKPFEIVLVNDDFMAHNLVVVKPGTSGEVGGASASMSPSQLDAAGRAFLPKSPHILAATALVETGRRARLEVPAIASEGSYEYVCTVPGHWILMRGTLVVTKDVEAWLQQHPGGVPTESGQGDAAGHRHGHEHGK
ncbi:MAG: HEAT repeat domain-containing protein [Planctomycetes bacterium]|nr:HEAT repeat domain-containing protein [Planctomycetota bacterium]